MKLGELKQVTNPFSLVEILNQTCGKSSECADKLPHLLSGGGVDQEVDIDLKKKIINIIEEFWIWASVNLLQSNWRDLPTVKLWIKLEKDLNELGLDTRHRYHFYFFQCLQMEFNQRGTLPLEDFLPILINAGRMLSYSSEDEKDAYPFNHLKHLLDNVENKKIKTQNDHLRGTVSLISILFYLLQHHITTEQLKLLPELINCRVNTTTEEQRSELAIIKNLTQSTAYCMVLFKKLGNYLDRKEINENKGLKKIEHLLPRTSSQLRAAVTNSPRGPNQALIANMKIALEHDLQFCLNQGFDSVMEMTCRILHEMKEMKEEDKADWVAALKDFCYSHYQEVRRSEPVSLLSLWPFSGATKLSTAEKLKPNDSQQKKLGFFESLAARQGRLRELSAIFNLALSKEEEVSSAGECYLM